MTPISLRLRRFCSTYNGAIILFPQCLRCQDRQICIRLLARLLPYPHRPPIVFTSYLCFVLLFPLCLGLIKQFVGTVGFDVKTGMLFSANFITYSNSFVLDSLNILRGLEI